LITSAILVLDKCPILYKIISLSAVNILFGRIKLSNEIEPEINFSTLRPLPVNPMFLQGKPHLEALSPEEL